MKIKRIVLPILFFSVALVWPKDAYCLNGYIETKVVYFFNKEDIFESRNRFLLEQNTDLKDWLRFYLGARIDGLLSNREEDKNSILAKVDDTYLAFYFPKIEVKIGYSKVYWGKLDQLSPTDVINPLDISKIFLAGEKQGAKLSAPLVDVSYYLQGSNFSFVFVPFFEKTTFDELNESSSPFNVLQFPLPVEQEPLPKNLENTEYGGRFSSTFNEIDWSLYYFRGFQDSPSYRLYPADSFQYIIKAEYLKGNMFGYDFELVKGKWGIRGEGALLNNVGFQKKDILDYTKGKSLTSGLGIDRSFGNNYLNLSALYRKIFVDDGVEEEKDEMTLTVNSRRKFSYETKVIEFFSIYNLMSNSIFLKGVFSINLFENLWADLSIGIFEGNENDIFSKFKDCDFFSIDFKYNF